MDAKLDVDASMEGIAWLGIGWVRARICYIFGVTELPVSERVLCHWHGVWQGLSQDLLGHSVSRQIIGSVNNRNVINVDRRLLALFDVSIPVLMEFGISSSSR